MKSTETMNSKIKVNVDDNKQYPNELNISIECIADCVDELNEELKYKNELLTSEYRDLKTKSDDLKHKNDILMAENELLRLKNEELNHRVICLNNSLNNQKQQNLDLAKHLQIARIKLRDNKNEYHELTKEFYEHYELYDKYHRHYLNVSNFIDMVIKKLNEFDVNLNVICERRFSNFSKYKEQYKTITTIDRDAVFVLGAYLRKIQLKIDNLMVDR